MRTSMKLVSSVLAVCMLASSSVTAGFAAGSGTAVSKAEADVNVAACEKIEKAYTYDGNDLGATYSKSQTVFKVWSPTATEVTLNRFATGSDSEPGAAKLGTVKMEKLLSGGKWTGVWTATVKGDIVNTYYTYTITSAHPVSGELQTAETQDVYSVATGVNGKRSMVCDLDSTDPDGWSSDKHVVLESQSDSTVWEIHIKDMSWDASSGVSNANRGKYLAFTEADTTVNGEGKFPTMVNYLKELGVTTVQINPFYDFQSVDEAGAPDQFNWGYDPQNYNVPEGSYSSNPNDGNVRIKECKQMIQALHNAGISVVMDVVYNHTYSNHKDHNCFQATVPDYYFRKFRDADSGQDFFSNKSGCGNDVASERAMVNRYVVQSCMYWVNEYHVDGFRFDLMGLMDVKLLNDIRAEMDKVDPRLSIWGEGWDMMQYNADYYDYSNATSANRVYSACQKNAAKLDSRVGFFNDSVRDGAKGSVFTKTDKGFIQGLTGDSSDGSKYSKAIKAGVFGNSNSSYKAAWLARGPEQCVNYVACHDNATLWDHLNDSYTNVGIKEGDALYGERNETALEANRMAAGILYTSQGITFILAGEEFARTKYGNENSYNASPEINKLDWSRSVEYADLVGYYKGLMKIRKAFTPLTAPDKTYQSSIKFAGAFNDATTLMYFTITNDQPGEWNKMAVVYNASPREQTTLLNDTTVGTDYEWVILAKGDQAGLTPLGTATGKKIKVPANSVLIAVDKAGYEAAGITDTDMGVVEVNFVDQQGKKLDGVDTIHLTGKVGTAYQTTPSAAVSEAYIFDKIEGNAEGTFTAATQTVNYVYRDAAKVTVNYVLEDGTELAPSVTLYGEPGASYTAPDCDTIPEQYIFKEVQGNKTGEFTADEQVVNFVYKDAMVVNVKYVYLDGTELAPAAVLYGEPGAPYSAPKSDAIPEIYMFKEIKGDKDGTFGTEPKTVTFVYTDYVPESIRQFGDVDGNGSIGIEDVTALQRILAEYDVVSDERMAQLDFDYNGKTDINDATMLQRYLSEMKISQGTVTINYYLVDGGTLTDAVTFKDRVGDDLVAPAISKFGYELDETKLPKLAGRKVSFGAPIIVNYYYKASNDMEVNLHIKHSGDAAWTPKLWIWNTENYAGGVWPGAEPTLNPETGWSDYSFEYSDKEKTVFYNLIVSDQGNPQTNDLNKFTNRELWIIINDDKVENQTNFLSIYTANPELVADPSQFEAVFG